MEVMECSIDDCTKPVYNKAHNWCMMHYDRWWTHGDPNYISRAPKSYSLEQKFNYFGYEVNDTGCWIWQGYTSGGYGAFKMNGKHQKAHRVSYLIHKGEIGKGLVVLHSCDVPLCVNPDHLSLGTQADNIADMGRKGRQRAGRRWTDEQIAEAKEMVRSGQTKRAVEAVFGMSEGTMTRVFQGKIWKHIP